MTVPTPAELQLLETKDHATNLWLSIYRPSTIMAAQVNNASAAKNDRVIDFDNVTSGSYLSIEPGMTLWLGSSPGTQNLGKIRVRSATSSQIIVAANSDVQWADNAHITIIDYHEIWAVYPRIIKDPSNPLNTLWYKDYDIAYTDQNDILGTFICMGPNRAGFVNEDQFYSASGTYNLLGDALTYEWWFKGGNPTGSSSHTPGNVSYSTPGHYVTRLQVVSASGATGTSYRHISIYDRPEDGTNNPVLKWSISDFNGTRDNGGYTAKIQIRETIPFSTIEAGALVVIFAENWYGSTKQSIGGNAVNTSKIFFVGYITDETIHYDYQQNYVEFTVGSPTEEMKRTEAFAVGVDSSSDPTSQAASDADYPSAWALVKDLDVRRGIFHYLRWHSTVLECCDFEFKGTDYQLTAFDASRESIYAAINDFIQSALMGEVVSDRQGKIWAEVSASVTDNASGTFPVTMILNHDRWMNEPSMDVGAFQPQETSAIEAGGIAYCGPETGTYAALLSIAPGNDPTYRGSIETIDHLALYDQAQLNTLTGNLFTWKAAGLQNSDLDLRGAYTNLDIAPQEIISWTVESGDTPREISFNERPFSIRNVSWKYDAQNMLLLPSINLHQIPLRTFTGDTIDVPVTPPTTTTDGGSIDVPPITVPPLPLPVISPIPVIPSFEGCRLIGLATVSDADGSANLSYQLPPAAAISGSFDTGGFYNSGDPTTINLPYTGYYQISLDAYISLSDGYGSAIADGAGLFLAVGGTSGVGQQFGNSQLIYNSSIDAGNMPIQNVNWPAHILCANTIFYATAADTMTTTFQATVIGLLADFGGTMTANAVAYLSIHYIGI